MNFTKYLFIFVCILAFASCSNNTQNTNDYSEPAYSEVSLWEKECHGHIYVICNKRGKSAFMLHSPNCKCFLNNK